MAWLSLFLIVSHKCFIKELHKSLIMFTNYPLIFTTNYFNIVILEFLTRGGVTLINTTFDTTTQLAATPQFIGTGKTGQPAAEVQQKPGESYASGNTAQLQIIPKAFPAATGTPEIAAAEKPAESPQPGRDELKSLYQQVDGCEKDVIELEKGLTSRPALNICDGGQGDVKKADYLKEYMKSTGYTSMEEIKAPDPASPDGYHSNLIFRYKGKNSDRTIWLMSHLDTVPAGNLQDWHTNPFDAVVKDGRIYGRGVEDDQQGIVSSAIAMKALNDKGVLPEHDVALLFVTEEEIGSEHGILYVMKEKPDIFKKNDIVIVPDGGNAEGTMIETAEKAILWMKFTTHGKTAHGSRPDLAVNANRAGSAFVVRLNDLYKEFNARDPVFTPDYSTFEPTERDANVPNVNTIPGQDVFYMDSRVLPAYKLDEVLKKIDEIKKSVEKEYHVTIDTEIDTKEEAPPETPVDAPVVKALASAVRDVCNVEAKPMGIGGGTVAAYIRNAGIPAAVWIKNEETEHGPDENVKISNLLDSAKVFLHVVTQKDYEKA
jgi:succinyl-diaminopimelate desuccinylase